MLLNSSIYYINICGIVAIPLTFYRAYDPTHTMTLQLLKKIGVSEGEIRVYTVLLEHGRSPVNTIHEQTGIERRNIYDILNKLIERGLVAYVTENKRRYFQVAHPKKIIGYIEEQQQELEQTKKDLEKEIPALIKQFEFSRPSANAQIYRGPEGMKAVWEDMLNYKDIYWIGSGRYIPKKLPHFFTNWNKRRIKAKIKIWNIMRWEMRKEVTPFPFESIKFLPKEFSGSPTVIGIHGDRVVNMLLGDDLFAFVIEYKGLAENYRQYHKYLWEHVAKG